MYIHHIHCAVGFDSELHYSRFVTLKFIRFILLNVSDWCRLHLRWTRYVSWSSPLWLGLHISVHVHGDTLCVCFTVACSSLCHEEMAAFKWPWWLKLWSKGLPESQHVHRGDRGRSTGTPFVWLCLNVLTVVLKNLENYKKVTQEQM